MHAFALPSQACSLCSLAGPGSQHTTAHPQSRNLVCLSARPQQQSHADFTLLNELDSLPQFSWQGEALPPLWLSTGSSSPHCLQHCHWGWEGKGRGQMCTNHTGYKRPLKGPGYLHGKYFQGRCFKAPWVIWSLQATETFPHNLWDKPWWLHKFNPSLSEETSLGTPHVTFNWAKNYVENYLPVDMLWEKKRA